MATHNKTSRNFRWRHHKMAILAIIVLLSALIGGGLVAVSSYQDAVYDADRAKYEHEKGVFDAQQDSIVSAKRDSLYASWVADNDTTIRSVEQIKHNSKCVNTMRYIDSLHAEIKQTYCGIIPGDEVSDKLRKAKRDELWKQRNELISRLHKKVVKTGRYECSPSDNGKMICEDETRIIWQPENITIYWVDTIWSSGYVSREQWVSKANKYADSMSTKAREEYEPYRGHEFHYILKESSALYKVWYLIAIITPISFLLGLGVLISYAFSSRKERKS